MRSKIYIEELFEIVSKQYNDFGIKSPDEQLNFLGNIYIKLLLRLDKLSVQDQKRYLHDTFITAEVLKNLMDKTCKIYRIAEKFGKHLEKTNLDVPCSLLQFDVGTSFCLEFPFMFKIGDDYHRNALVTIGPAANKEDADHGLKTIKASDAWRLADRGIAILFPDYDEKGKLKGNNSYFVLRLESGTTIGDSVLNISANQNKIISDEEKRLVAFVAKCLLYIKSGDPDLVNEDGYFPKTLKRKKILASLRNFCPFDVTNVGYSFNKTIFHIDSTNVVGFFRWQRYGPEFSLVKLIWINEHVRHFNKTETHQGETV